MAAEKGANIFILGNATIKVYGRALAVSQGLTPKFTLSGGKIAVNQVTSKLNQTQESYIASSGEIEVTGVLTVSSETERSENTIGKYIDRFRGYVGSNIPLNIYGVSFSVVGAV